MPKYIINLIFSFGTIQKKIAKRHWFGCLGSSWILLGLEINWTLQKARINSWKGKIRAEDVHRDYLIEIMLHS